VFFQLKMPLKFVAYLWLHNLVVKGG